jgi:hypothetical protein
MKRILFLPGLLLMTGCGADLKEFSPDGKFTVLMAGTPKEETRTVSGVTTRTYTIEERNGVYGVSVSDYPGNLPWIPEEIETRLKLNCKTLVEQYGARQTGEQDVKLAEKYPGRQVEADLTDRDGVLRARFYVVNGRLYQLTALGTRKWANSAEASRFLGSLTVKE